MRGRWGWVVAAAVVARVAAADPVGQAGATEGSANTAVKPVSRLAGWLPDPVKVGYVLRPDSLVDKRPIFIDVVRSTGRNLWILDASYDRDRPSRWSAQEIHVMRLTDPQRKIVAVLSVATAERWREYWEPAWADAKQRPDWLLTPRDHDPGTWRVKWWAPEWKELVKEELDGVLARGFDGVVFAGLDDVLERETVKDVYQPGAINPETKRPWREDLAQHVAEMARYVRGGAAGRFVVMGMDAPELLAVPTYASTVDGVIVQDMFRYGEARVAWLDNLIQPYLAASGTVLLIEDQQGASPEEARKGAAIRGLATLFNEPGRSNLGLAPVP